ncbi:ompetence-damaged protein, partial [Pseudomonas aeruginosa]|nr:ompetence-damaged protein [Pseudomonas aeruginosa]
CDRRQRQMCIRDRRFHGDPAQMRREATRWALRRLPEFHQRALRGERA